MKLKSGEGVFDRTNSHLHRGMEIFLPSALAQIESRGREFIAEEAHYNGPIGKTLCVETHPGDRIVYAQRVGRAGLTRFVENRTSEPCSSVVVVLKKAEESSDYVLITAFIGCLSEPEPWDRRAFNQQADSAEAERKSREFWNSHALVWGVEQIIIDTITTECPW